MDSKPNLQLTEPVVACTPASNHAAHLTVAKLAASGIAAAAVEDNSPGGIFAVGTLSGIHRPQVFVGKADLEAALTLLADMKTNIHGNPSDALYCYHCGSQNDIGAAICNECGAEIDSDDEPPIAHKSNAESMNDSLRKSQRLFAYMVLVPVIVVPLVLFWLYFSRFF